MTKQHLIIIGGGMAGSKLASELLTKAPDQYRITVIGEEARIGYNRIMLSSLLAGEIKEQDMNLINVDELSEQGVQFICDDPAIRVSYDHKQVVLRSGTSLNFDKVVFATGSRSRTLDIQGNDALNVIGFRDWQDVDVMAALPERSKVTVIGAGLLGLEAAVGLTKRGHTATVVHRSGHILNRQLDQKAASLLQNKLESMGIAFRLGVNPTTLIKSEQNLVHSVVLDDKSTLETQCVVMAAGITPETQLAKSSGLIVNRAIQVNERLQTSVEGVYAIGECSEFANTTFGLVAPIWDQIDVLCEQLIASSQYALAHNETPEFRINPIPVKLKVSGINLFSVGDLSTFTDRNSITFVDASQHHYRRLVVNDDKLVGAILFGNVADGGWYFQLIQNQTNVSALLDRLIFGEAYCTPIEHEKELLEKRHKAS
ncbi:NAD(P)/FAD-dependent oxidoreductase [Marinomonas mediterranea]|uniref:NAD(P)/FAD-dependent oxidoreductase n=1 Tax=Marinomonas mediterranea TaxID=119864 RepID=UPI00234BD1C5|nr:FAD-dependent oxidoreductase [Marinomonas mediterranea]WCN10973.1 FAD-dependent oxidoreductase [Marinomonas mediterranea]